MHLRSHLIFRALFHSLNSLKDLLSILNPFQYKICPLSKIKDLRNHFSQVEQLSEALCLFTCFANNLESIFAALGKSIPTGSQNAQSDEIKYFTSFKVVLSHSSEICSLFPNYRDRNIGEVKKNAHHSLRNLNDHQKRLTSS